MHLASSRGGEGFIKFHIAQVVFENPTQQRAAGVTQLEKHGYICIHVCRHIDICSDCEVVWRKAGDVSGIQGSVDMV